MSSKITTNWLGEVNDNDYEGNNVYFVKRKVDENDPKYSSLVK